MIRNAEYNDIESLLDLLKQICEYHHNLRPDIFSACGTKYNKDELIKIIDDNTRPIFVYEEDNKVLGYAFLIHKEFSSSNVSNIKTLYIDDLCVDKNHRGKHIGHKLYDYIVEYARNNNFYNITLNAWAGNDNALRFYESNGLKIQKYGMEMVL